MPKERSVSVRETEFQGLPPRLLYVAGIAPRCGSNYLYDLITRHPECAAVAEGEDYFLLKLDFLRLFAGSVFRKWRRDWTLKKSASHDDLMAALGSGLATFLRQNTSASGAQGDARDGGETSLLTVTKTPHVDNIRFFPRVFENGFLVVLVRDGRAVAESTMRTFGDSFDDAVLTWRTGARTILDFLNTHGWSSDWHRVVRYEDVVRDPAGEIECLLDGAGLPAESYPFHMLDDTPVIGSSTYGQSSDQVTWDEKKKDDSFDPLERFANWDQAQHDRFDWLAGDELRALKYPSSETSSNTAIRYAHQRLLDLRRVQRHVAEGARAKVRDVLFSYATGTKP